MVNLPRAAEGDYPGGSNAAALWPDCCKRHRVTECHSDQTVTTVTVSVSTFPNRLPVQIGMVLVIKMRWMKCVPRLGGTCHLQQPRAEK